MQRFWAARGSEAPTAADVTNREVEPLPPRAPIRAAQLEWLRAEEEAGGGREHSAPPPDEQQLQRRPSIDTMLCLAYQPAGTPPAVKRARQCTASRLGV